MNRAACFCMLLASLLPCDGSSFESTSPEKIDGFKVLETFEDFVSIMDSNNDSILECLKAHRSEIDPDTKTATFVWTLQPAGGAPVGTVHFYAKVEDDGEVTYTVEDDPTVKTAQLYYTDYETCLVEGVEYQGDQCILWTQRALKDSVPQDCIDHFVDICGVTVPKNSRDLCYDGEGDF
ncbi:uncharacterized protein LOC144151760 [Haemaphysalis longicornis]